VFVGYYSLGGGSGERTMNNKKRGKKRALSVPSRVRSSVSVSIDADAAAADDDDDDAGGGGGDVDEMNEQLVDTHTALACRRIIVYYKQHLVVSLVTRMACTPALARSLSLCLCLSTARYCELDIQQHRPAIHLAG